MGASAQIFGGIIRGGSNYEKFGDPFEWSVAFVSDPEIVDWAILVGAVGEVIRHRVEVFQALKAIGFHWVCWERKKDGKSYWIERKL